MSYRITDINFDPSRRDEFLDFTESQREKIQAVYGLQTVHVAEVGEGQSVIIARYDNE